ncbi:putative LuxR-family transcriptional regulator [Actinoplanes missouriensis 431]|uniref:Putative LuxR-family transcriptional regulator n=1 Tax=Actinoplanes missouriensis (strain ATCC 14538 / DSM 43046 / CBS 188.64 / JCM 3121 / NBRC 102363 / NCIMB 12654 / NRRL B-3342 / UNCC 431) TaxID=512565 RepID=I0H3V2_ACTM4|nr:LuxR family transcriptional regulator [Actinoplanes missouriensis]BAL87689.1 putative LuxR-family transcriptional regulator [Actinoplanes missouriensis 431]
MGDEVLIGRARELADLTAVVGAAGHGSASLLLSGAAGMGKTALLEAAADDARRRGYRIRYATTSAHQPYALLRNLLGVGNNDLAGLPQHLRRQITGLWSPQAAELPPDEPAVVTALLLTFDLLTRNGPALIVADDVHHADEASLRILASALRNTSTERIAILLAARDGVLPDTATPGIPRYELGPLPDEAAARLLDTYPLRPGARSRAEILWRADGNPLALRVLSDPREQPPHEFTTAIRALPPATRWLLLHAALAGATEHIGTLTRAAGMSLDLRHWMPAEQAGLITVRDRQAHFRHPLYRAACTVVETPGDVARAHRNLAVATDDPYHRARHLAEGTPGRDEAVAAALEAAADGSIARSDYLAAAGALQSAAERSGDDEAAARRYARAVFAAHRSGDPEWTIELYEKTTALTGDPDVTGLAACGAGYALVHSARPWEAFDVAARAVRGGARNSQVTLAATLVAAAAALHSGSPAHREQLPGMLALAGEAAQAEDPLTRDAVLAIADPAAFAVSGHAPQPTGTGPGGVTRMLLTGMIAYLLDESAKAGAELHGVWEMGTQYGAHGAALGSFPAMALALIEAGKWGEAERLLDSAEQCADVRVPVLDAALPALRAVLRALRHEGTGGEVTLPGDQPRSTLIDSLRQRAAGLTALAAGDHPTAYRHFRRMWDDDGVPRHYFLGPRSLPQLALSAARTGNHAEAERILSLATTAAGESGRTGRLGMLLAHAAALIDETDRAEDHFHQALADPSRALRWPLEYAEVQLNLGLWLRGRRRLHDARPHLLAARDTFLRLGAASHADQAHRGLPVGLRGAGEPAPEADAFAALTAQKQMIARMAAEGMSNREIADKLFLSPRTVGSHLYRIYAELGVGSRHQLRTLIRS